MKHELYHYNYKALDEILTLKAQDIRGIKKMSNDDYLKMQNWYKPGLGYYYESVSFFFDPLPLDLIAKKYTHEGSVYKPGKEIIEHVIVVDDIKDCPFAVVENPISNFMVEYLYSDFSETYEELFFSARTLMQIVFGLQGVGKEKLIKAIEKFKGSTRPGFERLIKDKDFDTHYKFKYAPTVPHLMLYPVDGCVKVSKTTKRVIE